MATLTILTYSVRALSDFDQSDKSCRDLGHCRSVWDIIWTCLAVIFSCTWVAIHPNVPKQGKSQLWKFGRGVWAFVIALIAPELIVVSAVRQRFAAKELLARIPPSVLIPGFIVWIHLMLTC